MKVLRAIAAFFYLMVAVQARGETREVFFRNFEIKSEGSRPKVQKLLLDRQGFIWLGTDRGIFLFDGQTFTTIGEPGDSIAVTITALFQDSQGTIWAGTESGLVVTVTKRKPAIIRTIHNAPGSAVSSFAENRNGDIFLSTRGDGIYFRHQEKWNHLGTTEGLSDNYCYWLAIINGSDVYTGSDQGLNKLTWTNNKIALMSSPRLAGFRIILYAATRLLPAGNFFSGHRIKVFAFLIQ